MTQTQMPTLRPLPIKTKNCALHKRIWRWVTTVREWEVMENWEYSLPNDGPCIIVPKGFLFDGASIPRPLWGVLSPTGLLLVPGLIHDFGYRYDYLWAKGGRRQPVQIRQGPGSAILGHHFQGCGQSGQRHGRH